MVEERRNHTKQMFLTLYLVFWPPISGSIGFVISGASPIHTLVQSHHSLKYGLSEIVFVGRIFTQASVERISQVGLGPAVMATFHTMLKNLKRQ
jgi:hypothetical protein